MPLDSLLPLLSLLNSMARRTCSASLGPHQWEMMVSWDCRGPDVGPVVEAGVVEEAGRAVAGDATGAVAAKLP
jgi:hypothetical protein